MWRYIVSSGVIVLCLLTTAGASVLDARYARETPQQGDFALVSDRYGAADIVVAENASKGLLRAVNTFAKDINKVTGVTPRIKHGMSHDQQPVVVVGELGKSVLIDNLVQQYQLDTAKIRNAGDAFIIHHIASSKATSPPLWLIIGGNMRGAIYGLFDISANIGVSPWYWWADVPVEAKSALFLKAGTHIEEVPEVAYRGIFLNDEAPALSNWSKEKFGGFNAKFYVHVFELLQRLRGNFLWPAMWDSAFGDDDKNNATLANEMGIVMSTSHHEPLMRADKEWDRYGQGPWEFSTNGEALKAFWEEGVERYKDKEAVFTLGMRGQNDTPMSEGENVALLETIIDAQRAILSNHFPNTDISEIPQVWTLYKEVQGFYERGMRVPDDVTLLWSDDNFGNIRRLPTDSEKSRKGGAGVYYHFDYVGGPRSYRWINTMPLGKVFEQMKLAYEQQARKIWVVNVGDLKPMELPIDFFLSMAWAPSTFNGQTADIFVEKWAAQQFGEHVAPSVATILKTYTQQNGQRKPEAMSADTYSVLHYHEAETRSKQLAQGAKRSGDVMSVLPGSYQDSFFQLVRFPMLATQAVFEMNRALALNQLYAKQDRASVNDMAVLAQQWFEKDAELTKQFHELGDGRWNHMMSQPHIGYVHWRNPPANLPPVVQTKPLVTPAVADMGVAVEGEESYWPKIAFSHASLSLPAFTQFGESTRTITIYNRQAKSFDFSIEKSAPWIHLSAQAGTVDSQREIAVSIDYEALEPGKHEGTVNIFGTGWGGAEVLISATKYGKQPHGFVETDGVLSVNASAGIPNQSADWQRLAQHGRTGEAMKVAKAEKSQNKPTDFPSLSFPVWWFNTGEFPITFYLSPSLAYSDRNAYEFGYSLDSGEIQWLEGAGDGVTDSREWESGVLNNVREVHATLNVRREGAGTLRVYVRGDGVVLQKIVVDTGGLTPSYLGPPMSPYMQ